LEVEYVAGVSAANTACRHQDSEVIGNGPKATVEKPVGGFAEGDSIGGGVAATAFELVNIHQAVNEHRAVRLT
jgi:hypothetical protein